MPHGHHQITSRNCFGTPSGELIGTASFSTSSDEDSIWKPGQTLKKEQGEAALFHMFMHMFQELGEGVQSKQHRKFCKLVGYLLVLRRISEIEQHNFSRELVGAIAYTNEVEFSFG